MPKRNYQPIARLREQRSDAAHPEIGDKHVADDNRADTCLYVHRPIMCSGL
jgi:hypothetical protein